MSECTGVARGSGSTRMTFTLTQSQLIPVMPHRKRAAIFYVGKSRYLAALGQRASKHRLDLESRPFFCETGVVFGFLELMM